MKTLSEYLALPYHMEIIEDHDESGYAASFPELHGCLSCGETVSDAIANAMDAKRTWLEAALEKGVSIREPNGAKRSQSYGFFSQS